MTRCHNDMCIEGHNVESVGVLVEILSVLSVFCTTFQSDCSAVFRLIFGMFL